jgi:hypothetical protein
MFKGYSKLATPLKIKVFLKRKTFKNLRTAILKNLSQADLPDLIIV